MRSVAILALAALLAAPSLASAGSEDRGHPSRGSRGNGGGHGNGWGRGGTPGGGNGNGWGRGGAPGGGNGNARGRGGPPSPPPSGGGYVPGGGYAPGRGYVRGGGYVPAPGVPAPGGYAPAPTYGSPRWATGPATYPTAPAPSPGYAYPVTTVDVPRPLWWWGWGWGWGYYPLYPHPAVAQMPPDGAERIATTLSGSLATMRGGAATGVDLAVEGRTVGFQAGIDAVAIDGVTGGVALGSSSAIGWGTAHVTWSVVSEDAFRLRLEVGGSMLSMPAGGTFAGTTWAGRVAFGPDVGVSGHVGLLGPIGIEGHARVTPVPVPVTDAGIALALRGGPLAITGGWRSIHVAGNGVDAPVVRFAGPELGLALIF